MSTSPSWVTIAIVLAVAFSIGDFVRNPEKYGEIMRRFDEARYGAAIAD